MMMKAVFVYATLVLCMVNTSSRAADRFSGISSDMGPSGPRTKAEEEAADACNELGAHLMLDNHQNEAALIKRCNADPSYKKSACTTTREIIASDAFPNRQAKLPAGLTCN
jgi:hypothetical protein